MGGGELTESLRRFIFDHIDSAELLDVLLMIAAHPEKSWTAETISQELRFNVNSVRGRLWRLREMGLLRESAFGTFSYYPRDATRAAVVVELKEFNALRRHQLLQLIFSPLKQVRTLADGFRVKGPKTPNDNGDNNG